MKRTILLAALVLGAFTGESPAINDTDMYLQVRDAAQSWKNLSRILITPLIHEGGRSISIAGFGVIEGEDLRKFVAEFGAGQKEILSGYSDGVKVRLYFLYKDRGFSEADSRVCWLNKDEVVGAFAIDDGRINIRFPDKVANLISAEFVTDLE